MTTKSKNSRWGRLLLLLPLFLVGITVKKTPEWLLNNQTGEITDINQISGDVFDNQPYTGYLSDTGDTEQLSDRDKFTAQQDQGNFFTFNPPLQKNLGSDGNINTQILRDYIKDNTYIFRLPSKIKEGYLYIKLNKTFDFEKENIFMVVYPNKMYGKLILNNVENKEGKEFLIKLDSLKYRAYPDLSKITFNWIDTMSYFNQNNYISMFYITTRPKSYIEQIIITYDI